MSWILLAVGLTTAPLKVQMATAAQTAPLLGVAEDLRSRLAELPQLTVRPRVITASTLPAKEPQNEAETLVAEARTHYAALEPTRALAKLARAQALLRPQLDNTMTTTLLARALRVAGLTYLFLEQERDASQSFVSAYFLDPEYTPGADQWPPRARLAYADAIAQTRQSAPGSLSVQVTPAGARIWLDGHEQGRGSMTIATLSRGAHHILVARPGYQSFAGVVFVEGQGKLNQTSVFLEVDKRAPGVAVAEMARSLGTDAEQPAVRRAAGVLAAELVLLVANKGSPEQPVAWLFDGNGHRRGGPVPLDDRVEAAREIARRLALRQRDAVAPPEPWYLRWYTLTAAGAVAVGGLVALLVALDHEPTDRVSFHLGDPP